MSKRFRETMEALGAEYLGQLPDFGGGAFAAAQLAKVISSRLGTHSNGAAEDTSSKHRMRLQSVPITLRTSKNLGTLAKRISRLAGHRVSRRQVAALILERAVGAG